MRIVSWNVKGGKHHERIAERLLKNPPDLIALADCTPQNERKISAALTGFHAPIFSSSNPLRVVCYAREDLEVSEPPAGIPLPERWSQVYFKKRKVHVLAVYVPQCTLMKDLQRKLRFWSEILSYAEERKNDKTLIIGDLNTGLRGIDARQDPDPNFWCESEFQRLSEMYSDAWRTRHRHGAREFTWYSKDRDKSDASNAKYGFRLDHAFVSPPLYKLVQRCEYDHSVRHRDGDRERISDHSLIDVEIDIG
jgi:exonuclease III